MRALSLGLLLLSAACGPSRPILPSDAGVDGSTRPPCARNEDCNDNTPCTRDLCLVGGVCENSPDNSQCPAGQACVSGRGCAMPGARTCTSPSDCDDRIPCTRDTCLVDGLCRNQPDDSMCAMGQRCNPASGCGSSPGRCMNNADCNDAIDCTEDTCTVAGTCEHAPQNSRCTGGRTCNATMGCVMASSCRNDAECDDRVFCNGVERCNTELACIAGTPVACADMDPCTLDACNEMMRACTHTMDPACMSSAIRGIYDIAPSTMYRCEDSLGLGMTLVDYNIRFFEFNVMGTNLVVQGAPAIMTGPAPAGGAMDFDVRGVIAGSCNETFRLAGRFTNPTRTLFDATFTVTFTPAASCALVSNCRDQSVMVRGTRRP
jgi:hypothetical protein